jgi:lipopolysaccharide export system protein LptA
MSMYFSRSLVLFILGGLTAQLCGQMTPNAPIQNFRLPRFADNGYTQWVLQGERGIYDSPEQVRVEGMAMRVYSGDERMALELSMNSPEATLRLQENRGYSDSAIEIVGANFKITGVGWEWTGETKEIIVEKDTVVTFTQGIAGAFADAGDSAEASQTEIRSERLLLRTTEEAYYFEFTGGVHALSETMDLRSEQLTALADAPEARESGLPTAALGELDSIRRIVAREQVVIVQAGKTVKAEEAEFFPREQRANLSGAASVETKGAYLSGQTIRSQSGEIVIAGAEGVGRAQMILTETGGLGIQGAAALNSETIVLADTITMREETAENHFLFNGSVEVMSGAVQMRSARMTIVSQKAPPGAKTAAKTAADADTGFKVGEVKSMLAEGGVRIEQSGQVATGEQVTFYPAESRAVLIGDPRVTNGEAVVTGQSMELKPQLAIIRGVTNNPVRVRLPEMPDLGYAAFAPTLGAEAVQADKNSRQNTESSGQAPADTVLKETVVISRLLRMIEEPERTLFRFTEEVEVAATNLDATCERLDVITREGPSDAPNRQVPLELKRIEAYEDVVIKQTGRTATSERAFILPEEGKVILEGQAVVLDDRGKVSGHRMTLLQGQRRAIVEGGGPEGERARITLPGMPSGN